MKANHYTVARFGALLLYSLRSLSVPHLKSSLRTIVILLRYPGRYAHLQRSLSITDPFVLLAISLLISLLRLAIDPNVENAVLFLHLPSGFVALYILLFSVSSAIGSMLVPMFWHKVLGIRIDRDVFIGAMIVMYTVVEIPWDLSSPLWMPAVRSGIVAFWVPDAVKTIIMTAYCMIAGAALATQGKVDELRSE